MGQGLESTGMFHQHEDVEPFFYCFVLFLACPGNESDLKNGTVFLDVEFIYYIRRCVFSGVCF